MRSKNESERFDTENTSITADPTIAYNSIIIFAGKIGCQVKGLVSSWGKPSSTVNTSIVTPK